MMADAGSTNPTSDRWLEILRVCPVLFILAFVFCAGSPTTTVSAAARAYDGAIALADVQEIRVVQAGPVQGIQAREGSVSRSADRGPFTTPFATFIATNTGPPFENRYPQDTPGYTQRIAAEIALARSGTYIYVVQDGLLKIGPRSGNHIDLAEGRPVEAAGEFTTKGGKVVSFNNASGHYCPSGPEAEAAARAGFARYSMSITGPYTEVGG